MRQVAVKSQVSIATVSRVLNNRGPVDEATRKRVVQTAEALGYSMNYLIGQRGIPVPVEQSRKIELLLCPLPEQKNILNLDFIADVMRGIQSVLAKHAEIAFSFSTLEVDDTKYHRENEMIWKRLSVADVVIVLGTPSEKVLEYLHAECQNVILTAYDTKMSRFNIVRSDDFYGGVSAAEYLMDKGFREIGFLCGTDTPSHRIRRRGAMSAVADRYGFDAFSWQIPSTSDNDDVMTTLTKWLDSGKMPRAMIFSHFDAAQDFCKLLYGRGLKCPDDYSIVSFDEPGNNVYRLRITSFLTLPREIGIQAAERAMSLMGAGGSDKSSTALKILIPLEFKEGNSVRS